MYAMHRNLSANRQVDEYLTERGSELEQEIAADTMLQILDVVLKNEHSLNSQQVCIRCLFLIFLFIVVYIIEIAKKTCKNVCQQMFLLFLFINVSHWIKYVCVLKPWKVPKNNFVKLNYLTWSNKIYCQGLLTNIWITQFLCHFCWCFFWAIRTDISFGLFLRYFNRNISYDVNIFTIIWMKLTNHLDLKRIWKLKRLTRFLSTSTNICHPN